MAVEERALQTREESRQHTDGAQLSPAGSPDQRRPPSWKGYKGKIPSFLPLL